MPGARINYSIVVSATGTGTATNAVFTDNIPANTTYVPGSLRLNAHGAHRRRRCRRRRLPRHAAAARARGARQPHAGERNADDHVRRDDQLIERNERSEGDTHDQGDSEIHRASPPRWPAAWARRLSRRTQGCIVLKSIAEVEKEVVDAKGAKTTKLVPADKAVPGTKVVWTDHGQQRLQAAVRQGRPSTTPCRST